MKKKYLAPVAIALIATISITMASCGKSADEEVNATEAEVTTTEESTEETTVPETTATETTVEETTVAETKVNVTKADCETPAEQTKAAPAAEHVKDKAPAPACAADPGRGRCDGEHAGPVPEHAGHDREAGPILRIQGEETEDLEQEGYIALCSAVGAYRPEEGTLFASYAAYRIRQGMGRYLENCGHPGVSEAGEA